MAYWYSVNQWRGYSIFILPLIEEGEKMYETLKKTLEKLAGDDSVLEHPAETQEKTLLRILKKNATTLFSKKHSLDEIGSVDAYINRMPICKYDDFRPYIELMKQQQENVLVVGDFPRWVRTSGTSSSQPKLYPFTIESIESAGQILSKLMLSVPDDESEERVLLSGKMLMVVADVITGYIQEKPVGYISGVAAHDIQDLEGLAGMISPPQDILAMQEWETRWLEMARHASKELITMSVSTPPILLSYFKKITSDYQSELNTPDDIRDLWPDVMLIAGAGVKMSLYEKKFREVLGDQVRCREFYCASEGFFAYQKDDNEGLTPVLDYIFYEFIPLEEWRSVLLKGEDYRTCQFTRLTYDQVRHNTDYIIVVTTPSGLYSYIIGDIIRFLAPDRLVWVGRADLESNVAGEKMNEMHMSMLKKSIETTLGVEITNHVASVQEEPLRYVFAFEFEGEIEFDELVNAVDRSVREANPIYDWLREKNVLQVPDIVTLQKGTFERYFRWKQEQTGSQGQVKPPVFVNPELIEKMKQ